MEKLKIKVELREVKSEANPGFKGYADLTLGDIVIKDVAISEVENEKGKFTNFNMPTKSYETKDGEKRYVQLAEISAKEDIKKSITAEVRKTIIEALKQEETNEFGKKVAERETTIPYNQDWISANVNLVDKEEQTFKGYASINFGGILRLNEITYSEPTNNEGEKFTAIQFPQKMIEKDGEKTYQDKIFPIAEGLRSKMKEAVDVAYVEALERQDEKANLAEESENEEEENEI